MVDVIAAKTINSDGQSQGLPLIIKFYQLSGRQQFTQASFHQLWLQDEDTLRGDLLGKHQVMVVPGQHQKIQLTREDGANYLGVVAIFRQPQEEQWKKIITLSEKKYGRVFEIKDYQLVLKDEV